LTKLRMTQSYCKIADTRLYEAKREGRNQTVFE
jgi:PleD family two-component response regulator